MTRKLSLSTLSLILCCSVNAWAGDEGEPKGAPEPSATEPSEPEPADTAPGSDEAATDEPGDPVVAEEAEKAPAPRAEAPPAAPPKGDNRDEQLAREAFRLGDQLYMEGDYKGAVDSFERAYALSGRIEMLFNLANAHERLGSYEKASVALRGYIPHSPEEHRPALERRLERFEQLAEQEQVKVEKTEAAVKDLKENPRPFPLIRGLGIGFVTLGSASIITGIGFAVSAASARSQLDESCVDGARGRLCPADAEMKLSRDKTHSIVADATIIAGSIMAATGVYLIIRSKKKEREEVEMRVSVGPGSLHLGGSF